MARTGEQIYEDLIVESTPEDRRLMEDPEAWLNGRVMAQVVDARESCDRWVCNCLTKGTKL